MSERDPLPAAPYDSGYPAQQQQQQPHPGWQQPGPYGPPVGGYPPAPLPGQPYGMPPRATNTMAILGLVFAFVVAPLGIVFGAIGLKQTRERGEDGRGLALAGLIVGSILTGLSLVMVVVISLAAGSAVSALHSSASRLSGGLGSPAPSGPTGGGLGSIGEPVADGGSYGQVRLGMNADEVQVATGISVPPGVSCTTVMYTAVGASGQAAAIFPGSDEQVDAIQTPAGTKTDRGVGDGSTVDQVRAAYGQDFNIGEQDTQAGRALVVTTGDPSHPAGTTIGFALKDDGTVGPPMVGGVPGVEYC